MTARERDPLRLLPGLAVLRRYDLSWLRPDVLAGLTVAAYMVPQVMAYAAIAGLPPVLGLWAACAPLLVYAFVGSSRQLSVGPESATAILTAAAVGALVVTLGHDRYADIAAVLAIVTGLVCLVGWVARVGFLANLLSRPVLIGYLMGIAVLVAVSQLGNVTRLPVTGDSPYDQVASFLAQLPAAHAPTALLAASVLVTLVALKAAKPLWPAPLLVMLAAALVTTALGAERSGLRVIGQVPSGLPVPRLPSLEGVDLVALAPYALGIAVIAFSNNVLTARAFARNPGETVDAGQELFALGAINVAAGLTQGFPASCSSTRTVLGDAVGSKTQLHSLVALAAVGATLLIGGPVLSAFPTAALGAIVIYAATRLVDVAETRRIARFRRSELVLTVITAVGVVWLGVLTGIGVAVALSILNLVRRMSDAHDGILGYVPGLAGMHDVDDYPNAVQVPGLVVYRYDAPLFFGNAATFLRRALAAVEDAPQPVHWFLLNAEANVEVDLTGADTLEELRRRLTDRGIIVAMARVKLDLRTQLTAAGLVDALGADRLFATLPTAVAAYADWYEKRFGHRPPGVPATVPPVP